VARGIGDEGAAVAAVVVTAGVVSGEPAWSFAVHAASSSSQQLPAAARRLMNRFWLASRICSVVAQHERDQLAFSQRINAKSSSRSCGRSCKGSDLQRQPSTGAPEHNPRSAS
jgi:hypothetical protein